MGINEEEARKLDVFLCEECKEKEQKISSSLILKHIPYHLEFIFVGISEMLILYNIGWNTLKNKKL